jgi:cbb3-type cytochrome oxidase subunit 3
MRKYAYAWLTLGFFLVSFGLHWFFGWKAFQDEARAHHEAVELNQYLVQMGRDTFENWQSEFLQLMWQVVGLAYFLYVGSPSSKENDDRVEAKIDELLKQLPDGDKLLDELDHKYLRTHGHARPHAHQGS